MERAGFLTSEYWLVVLAMLIVVAAGTPYLELTSDDKQIIVFLAVGQFGVRQLRKHIDKNKPAPSILPIEDGPLTGDKPNA